MIGMDMQKLNWKSRGPKLYHKCWEEGWHPHGADFSAKNVENCRFDVSGHEDFLQTGRKDLVKENLGGIIGRSLWKFIENVHLLLDSLHLPWYLCLLLAPLCPFKHPHGKEIKRVLSLAWRFSLADFLLLSRTCVAAEFSLPWSLSSSQTPFFTKPVACMRVWVFFQTWFKLFSRLGGWVSARWFAQALSL